MATRIIIFAKAPVPGKAKTRLIPALGAEGAARLAGRMLERTAAEALAAAVGPVELCAEPDPADPEWQGRLPEARIELSSQGGGDLGERLARAAERATAGGEAVILIGTDCPGLDVSRLRSAAAMLATHDAVIHPTLDGGYALLGLKRFDRSVFAGVNWSTSAVASETLARLERLGWTIAIGDTLRDIDEPADLDAVGLAS